MDLPEGLHWSEDEPGLILDAQEHPWVTIHPAALGDPGSWREAIVSRIDSALVRPDHQCPAGRVEAYQRIDLAHDVIVQVGICVGCGQVVARRYTITGPGTGPWTVLSGALELKPRLVTVGWDGASRPMLRYEEDMHLPDSQRRIVAAEHRS